MSLQNSSLKGALHVVGRTSLLVGIVLLCASCTFIGRWDQAAYEKHNWGPWKTVHVCVYRDPGVTEQEGNALLASWTDGEAAKYRLHLIAEDKGPLQLAGGWHNDLMDQVAHIPLSGNCDRVFYLASHNPGDYVYANLPLLVGVAPPEVLGEVDGPTMTHGWAYVGSDSLLGVLLQSPKETVWHEFYHLVGGCPDQWFFKHGMDACYDAIQWVKGLSGEDGFYPSWSDPTNNGDGNGEIYTTRAEVNRRLAHWNDGFWP
jgi:hypothetical protein